MLTNLDLVVYRLRYSFINVLNGLKHFITKFKALIDYEYGISKKNYDHEKILIQLNGQPLTLHMIHCIHILMIVKNKKKKNFIPCIYIIKVFQ